MGKDRRRNSVKANKPSTSKSIDKITYCPKKHKQKFVKKLRQQLRTIGILPAYIYRLVGKGNPHISCILWGQRLELGQLN